VCAFAWWRTGALEHVPGQAERVSRISAGVAFDAAPMWAFDLWRSHTDEACTVVWWLAFGMLVVDGLRQKADADALRRGLFGLVPFVCTALIYALTPFHVGPAGFLDVRLAPLLALFSLLILRPSSGRLAGAALAMAALAGVGTAATATFEMRRIEREVVGDFTRVLDAMRPGTRVATLNFETRSVHAYFWPYVFAGAYHRLKPGTINSYSFTELKHWPINYAPDRAPPKRGEFWTYHPCEFRYRADGAYYDYVLVQGVRHDPFVNDHPGPAFRAIARSGSFVLFEKDDSVPEAMPDAPDRSVCRKKSGPAAYDATPP
jgi:hypothetical protein